METNDSIKQLADRALPKLVQILETRMKFESWGFRQSFYGVADEFNPSVIYNSDKCRIRFCWLDADMRDGPDSATLEILYGRLHASNQKRSMIWNGRNCYCWHRFNIINFLDGLSPSEAQENRNGIPPVISQFIQLYKEEPHRSNIEFAVRQEAFVWEHYGDRLFELFDLRRPDLWKQYMDFIKEFYQLDPFRDRYLKLPPREDIC